MKCRYCQRKEFNIMKLNCNHQICFFCIQDIKIKKSICCTFPIKEKKLKKQNLNDVNVHWYDTMYDYDNGII